MSERGPLRQAAREAAQHLRDRWRLARTARRPFPVAAVRPLDAAGLAALLSAPEAAAAWRADAPRLSALLPAEEIHGAVNPGDRRALHHLAVALAPARALEIGTHIGASTLHLAAGLGHGGGRLDTVDLADVNETAGPWAALGLPQRPEAAAAELGLAGRVAFHAQAAEAFLAAARPGYGLVFLDGDHAADAVYRETAAALALLAPGGVIVLHDVYPGARRIVPEAEPIFGPWCALARILREAPALRLLPLGTLDWETKPGSRRTSLAVLARAR